LLRDLGFDGIDINMGCPEKNVNKQGSGAALIGNPFNAQVDAFRMQGFQIFSENHSRMSTKRFACVRENPHWTRKH
jgi:hypothetical protein